MQAGLVIHEGQLTYGDRGLRLAVDLGAWWLEQTGLPLPLGANAIRKDLGPEVIREVNRLLHASIRYGLEHRQEALRLCAAIRPRFGPRPGRPFCRHVCERLDARFRPAGREAVRRLLAEGFEAGIIPQRVEPEFVS